MAKQTINLGQTANDGTGDSLRTGAYKINQNFDELYSAITTGINSISSGEGIAVTNSFGQVTITNTQPNRGSFNSILVSGQPTISTSDLDDTLTFVAGQNVTLTTNESGKAITIAVNNITLDSLTGTFGGTFSGTVSGTVSGTFDGDVTSTDIDTTLLKVSGNSAEALLYYENLQDQKQELVDSINDLNNQLDALESDLTDAQETLIYWQNQSPSSERTTAIAALDSQIILLEAQINSIQEQITDETSQVASYTVLIDELSPTLSTPYAAFTYDASLLKCQVNRTLVTPKLVIGDMTYPSVDGEYRQALITDGLGNLSWNSLLGKLTVNYQTSINLISPDLDGDSIVLETNESLVNQEDGGIEIIYHPHDGSSTKQCSIAVGPQGIILENDQNYINFYSDGIVYRNLHTSTYPQNKLLGPSATGIIYNSMSSAQTLKLLVSVTCNQEVQSAEIVVARSGTTVVFTAYAIVYTGIGPICEFDAQWNSIANVIEITATNLDSNGTAYFTVQGNELSSGN